MGPAPAWLGRRSTPPVIGRPRRARAPWRSHRASLAAPDRSRRPDGANPGSPHTASSARRSCSCPLPPCIRLRKPYGDAPGEDTKKAPVWPRLAWSKMLHRIANDPRPCATNSISADFPASRATHFRSSLIPCRASPRTVSGMVNQYLVAMLCGRSNGSTFRGHRSAYRVPRRSPATAASYRFPSPGTPARHHLRPGLPGDLHRHALIVRVTAGDQDKMGHLDVLETQGRLAVPEQRLRVV